MLNLAVHWHEGLFLRPHHLQAWDRHWHETTTASERWRSPYHYGLARIAINADALAAGFFQLDSVRAKMPEGTLIELSPGDSTERVDLRAGFNRIDGEAATTIPMQGSATLDVYLAVPRLQLGGCNVASAHTEQPTRYHQQVLKIPDDSDGASVEPIMFRRVNAKLLLSTDDLAGYDTLRIARVMRGNVGGAIATLDARYIPPLIDCAAWPTMRLHILRPIFDLVSTKSEAIGSLFQEHSIDPSSGRVGDIQNYLVLQALNQAAAVTSVITQASGIHPLDAYLELARIAGSLDLLGTEIGFQPIAPYDHEALGPLMGMLRRRIETRLRRVGQSPYQQRFFVGAKMPSANAAGMQVAVQPEWFQPPWQRVLGIRRGDVSTEAIEAMFAAGQLDCKLGSLGQVEELFTKRISGLELSPIRSVPKCLPSQSEWAFFEIKERGPAWEDVVRTGTLAFRFRERMIVNPQSLDGSRTIQLQLEQRIVSLQFAMFAIAGTET